MTDKLASQAYRPDIDGLRAIAVCSVVLFHAFPNLLPGGYVGVDIFFVISGYLIGKILLIHIANKELSFAGFYARRIKRIFPALILVLIFCYVFGWWSLLPHEFMALGKHIAAGAGFVSNLVLWGEAGYFDPAAISKPLLHFWSLGIEEQFYVLWPLFLWVCWRCRVGLLTPIMIVCLVSFSASIFTSDTHPVANFYSPLSRFWELLIGNLLAYQHLHNRSFFVRYANAKSFVGAGLIFAALALLKPDYTFPGWWALLPTIGTYLLIDAGAPVWINSRILSNRVSVWFGTISYPLYLWHWPFLSFGHTVFGPMRIRFTLAAVAASVLLAWLTYRLVERPIRFGAGGHHKVIALSAVCALVGSVGYATYASGGFPQRFPKEIQRIANFKYDFSTDARFPACWLTAENPFDGFDNSCIAKPRTSDEKSLVVWGDSHAARLYPGLAKVLEGRYAISQFTRNSCPPILDYGYEICRVSNDYILSEIKRLRPDTVVMFGVWGNYQSDWGAGSILAQELLKTVDRLKMIGIKNVVVLGMAPKWKGSLPNLVYESWRVSPFHKIPDRLSGEVEPVSWSIDAQLGSLLKDKHIYYVSVMQILCSKDGCLTHSEKGVDQLLSWDYGHLTTEGAELVARSLLEEGDLQ